MSGQLVGEVIDAWPALHKRGLSERGFHALIAIAEKCHTQTRQGSVRWDHIRNCLCGASKRSAQRAVHDLQTIGVVRVVKVGFNNNHGRVCAPIYKIESLTDSDTWVSRTHETDDDTQVSRSEGTDDDKPGTDDDKTGGRSRHPGVVLDGPLDGPLDGGSSRSPGTSLDEPIPSTNPTPLEIFTQQQQDDPEPPLFCRRHMPDGTDDNCGGCAQTYRNYEAWKRRTLGRLNELKTGIRQEIDACNQCNDYGQNGGHCPNHPNFKQPDIIALMRQRRALMEDLAA